MKNLITQSYWNPFTAIATNGKGYELDNIVIYTEGGILAESGCGWFKEQYNNNNSFKEGATIEDIHLRKAVDFSKKENFIVKDNDRTYETRYILYIYYKNVNFKAIELKKGSFWIEGIYSIELPEKTITCTELFGKTEMKSDEIKHKYYKTIEELEKEKYSSDIDNLKSIVKRLNKEIGQFEKMKIQEKEDILEDIIPFIYENAIDIYNNFIKELEK